jgi:hypothetical protein
MVIRLLAAGIIVVGGMNVGLELTRHRLRGVEISAWRCILGFLAVVLGLILFAGGPKLAERLTDDIDE